MFLECLIQYICGQENKNIKTQIRKLLDRFQKWYMLPYYVETELWDDGVVELEGKWTNRQTEEFKDTFYNIL